MEIIKSNHIKIKYHTTFCFILAMCIFSIMTVSCRPSAVDRVPPRPTVDEFNKQQQQQHHHHNLNQQQQIQEKQQQNSQQQQQQTEQPNPIKAATATTTTTNDGDNDDEKNYYGDLHPDKVRQIRKCNDNLDLMELCMRCAKVTKSPIVYPMCCDNEDNVKSWCEDYVYFGIKY